MVSVLYIIVGLAALSLLVLIHEMGHFLLAKAFKMPVDVFCIGYGKPLPFLKFKRKETTYGIGPFPFGGYVKIPGLDPRETAFLDDESKIKDFILQPYYKRALMAAGGPIANILAAVLIFSLVMMLGVIEPTTTIDKVTKDSPASKAGIRSGDTITAIDGKKVDDWQALVLAIRGTKKRAIDLKIKRKSQTLILKTGIATKEGQQYIGIIPKARTVRYNPFSAFYQGMLSAIITIASLLVSIYLLIVGKLPFRPVSPIGIVQVTSQAARHGLVAFLDFFAFLNIIIGVTNLFPIFPLDGAKIGLWTMERIKGSFFKTRTVVVLQAIGIGLLLVLVLSAVYMDILRPLPDPFR